MSTMFAVAFRIVGPRGPYPWVDISELEPGASPEDVVGKNERIEYAYSGPAAQQAAEPVDQARGEAVAWLYRSPAEIEFNKEPSITRDAELVRLMRELGDHEIIPLAPVTPPNPEQAVGNEVALPEKSRAALLWLLWHHQGGSSPVGQPIRRMLGIGQHERMSAEQLVTAKHIEALLSTPRPTVSTPAEVTDVPIPTSIDRRHPNQAYVTIGFDSEDACSSFITAISTNGLRLAALAAQPSAVGVPVRKLLRALVDAAWNEATESSHVPSTEWADRIINRVFATAPEVPRG